MVGFPLSLSGVLLLELVDNYFSQLDRESAPQSGKLTTRTVHDIAQKAKKTLASQSNLVDPYVYSIAEHASSMPALSFTQGVEIPIPTQSFPSSQQSSRSFMVDYRLLKKCKGVLHPISIPPKSEPIYQSEHDPESNPESNPNPNPNPEQQQQLKVEQETKTGHSQTTEPRVTFFPIPDELPTGEKEQPAVQRPLIRVVSGERLGLRARGADAVNSPMVSDHKDDHDGDCNPSTADSTHTEMAIASGLGEASSSLDVKGELMVTSSLGGPNETMEARAMEIELDEKKEEGVGMKTGMMVEEKADTSSALEPAKEVNTDEVSPLMLRTTPETSSTGYNTRYAREIHDHSTLKQASHTVTRYQSKRGVIPDQEPAHTLRSHREPTAVALAAAAQEKEIQGSPLADELIVRTRSHRATRSRQEESKKVTTPGKLLFGSDLLGCEGFDERDYDGIGCDDDDVLTTL